VENFEIVALWDIWIFRKWDVGGLDRAVSREGQVAGNCDCGNELSGSIKSGEFLD
jgi:hypothetical protein